MNRKGQTVEGSLEQKTEGTEEVSQVGVSLERTFQAEGTASVQSLGKSMLELFNSKQVKVMEADGGGDVVRRQGVVWVM